MRVLSAGADIRPMPPHQQPETLDYEPRPTRPLIRDDVAYFLPMATFLAFVWVGGNWPALYPAAYFARTIIVGVMLWLFWPHYTKVRWNYWWLGLIVGVVGIFQWIGMQLFLQRYSEFFRPGENVFDPTKVYSSPAMLWTFIAMRMIGAVIVVPVMEELFWRDYGWRSILAPNDFKLARVGEWGWAPFLIISGVFAVVHGNWWLTSIVWALMIGLLLVYTKSLGACIIAHATTNLLLALYVLWTQDWSFW
jgi:CAAX prenyl protease-like protein